MLIWFELIALPIVANCRSEAKFFVNKKINFSIENFRNKTPHFTMLITHALNADSRRFLFFRACMTHMHQLEI